MTYLDYRRQLEAQGWEFSKRPHYDHDDEPIVIWRLRRPNSQNYMQGTVSQAALRMAEKVPGALDALWLSILKSAREACP